MDDLIAQLQAAFVSILIFLVVLFVFSIVVGWKIFEKAGRPGWEVLIPIYSSYVFIVHILKLSPAWFWLQFIPLVNFVVAVILVFMMPFKLAEKFGKGGGFAVGLLFLGIIFYPILAFGSAQYVGAPRARRSDEENW